MIYDRLNNLKYYKSVSPNMNSVIEFVKNNDLSKLNIGKIEIDGNRAYLNVMTYSTKNLEDSLYESHRNYIDIHIVTSGSESILIEYEDNLKCVEKYDADKDCQLYKSNTYKNQFVIFKDRFALCMPDDCHMPGIKFNNIEQIKKVVFKISVQ